MIIDLSFLRTCTRDKYNEFLFNHKLRGGVELNTIALPLILYSIGKLWGKGDELDFINKDALIFAGCETLRQINNYYLLYRKL